MNAHVDPVAPDAAEVRTFFQVLHEAAGTATEGMASPGVLQLSRVHPADGKLHVVGRFPIGEVDRMTTQAVADASAGFNVYVEGRTVRADLPRAKRGDLADTVCVFALVIDADADMGKQHPQDCIRIAMDAVMPNGDFCIGWQKSAPKLTNALLQKASRLLVVDEFTSKMTGIRSRVAATHEMAIVETLLALWGTNTGTFQPDASITNGGDITLRRPALSLYGASPVRQFAESLASKDITNGWLNRFLLLPRYAPVPIGMDLEGMVTLPDDLVSKLRALHSCLPEAQMVFDNRGDICPGAPHLVPFSADANALNEENKRHQLSRMTRADEEAAYTLFGRYAEQIKRIALVLACGRSWRDLSLAQIEAGDMRFDDIFAQMQDSSVRNAKRAMHGAGNDNSEYERLESPTRPSLGYVSRENEALYAEELCSLLTDLRLARRSHERSTTRPEIIRASDLLGAMRQRDSALSEEEQRLKARIREIGAHFDTHGGMPAMTWAYHWVQRLGSDVSASTLDKLWHGVGSWVA